MGSLENLQDEENNTHKFLKFIKPVLPVISPRNVAVLMGGFSDERHISISSGNGVVEALKSLGHHVVSIDPSPILEEFVQQLKTSFPNSSVNNNNGFPDVVYNILHGKWGEDGTCQAILDTMGIPYTSSGLLSSALAMNKKQTRLIANAVGVRVPTGKIMSIDSYVEHGFPIYPHILKPIDSGSSFGVIYVKDAESGKEAARQWSYGQNILVEEYIPGRELSVAVFGGEVVGTVEIIFESQIFDIKSKYTKGVSQVKIPAPIHPKALADIERMCTVMYKELECDGIVRSDFRYDDTCGEPGIPYFLETNTQSGLTPTSLIPQIVSQLHGWSYNDVVQWCLENALKKEI